MTVTSDTSRDTYVGNGVATVFAYTFKIFAEGDLVVTKTDTAGLETTLVKDVDYTVSGAGSASGGNVTLTTALPGDGTDENSQKLTIRRVLTATQGTDLKNQGKFNAEVLERALDRLTMLVQQIADDATRALRLPESEEGAATTTLLPGIEERKGMALGFDPTTGQPGAYGSLSGATVSAAMIPVVQAATLAIARALLIEDGQIVNAKLADMATQRFKGRTTAGTGAPEDLTVAQVLAMLALDDIAVTRNTTAPNDGSVPAHVITPAGAEASIDLILHPKAYGAVALDTPDGTTTGGNKRATYACDLQRLRTAADQVASGQSSGLIASESSKAAGTGALVAASTASVVLGQWAAAIASNGATIGANYGYSLATGYAPTVRDPYSRAQGFLAGWQQDESFLFFRTFNATPAFMICQNSQVSLALNNNEIITGIIRVVAAVSGAGTNAAGYTIHFAAKRGANAAATSLIGSIVKDAFEDDAAWDVSLAADTTNGGINVNVTGAAATTIDWFASYHITRMTRQG